MRRGDLAAAAEIRHGAMPALQRRLDQQAAELAADDEDGEAGGAVRLLREEVSEEDIAAVVSQWTGIPVSKMLESERRRLLELERILGERGGRPGRRDRGGRRRHPPQQERTGRPGAAARRLHLPGPHRRRQDGAGQGAGRLAVRRRARADPHRHERVPGKARRVAADRRAAGLRRLRGGRPAHRGGAPPAVFGGAVRRAGEGAPGRVQRPAAASGRRPPDRRPGPRGRLPQHHRHHDQQRRQRPDPERPGPGGRARADRCD